MHAGQANGHASAAEVFDRLEDFVHMHNTHLTSKLLELRSSPIKAQDEKGQYDKLFKPFLQEAYEADGLRTKFELRCVSPEAAMQRLSEERAWRVRVENLLKLAQPLRRFLLDKERLERTQVHADYAQQFIRAAAGHLGVPVPAVEPAR